MKSSLLCFVFLICFFSIAQGQSDECKNAPFLKEGDYLDFDKATATPSDTSKWTGCKTQGQDVWYQFTATATESYLYNELMSVNSFNNFYINLFEGTCDSNLVCKKEINKAFLVEKLENLQIGSTYYIRVVLIPDKANYSNKKSIRFIQSLKNYATEYTSPFQPNWCLSLLQPCLLPPQISTFVADSTTNSIVQALVDTPTDFTVYEENGTSLSALATTKTVELPFSFLGAYTPKTTFYYYNFVPNKRYYVVVMTRKADHPAPPFKIGADRIYTCTTISTLPLELDKKRNTPQPYGLASPYPSTCTTNIQKPYSWLPFSTNATDTLRLFQLSGATAPTSAILELFKCSDLEKANPKGKCLGPFDFNTTDKKIVEVNFTVEPNTDYLLRTASLKNGALSALLSFDLTMKLHQKVENNEVPDVENALQLYPNPSDGSAITVDFYKAFASNTTYSIQDITGKIIQQGNLEGSIGEHSVTISVLHLVNGVYVFSLKTDNFVQNKRFLIQK